MYEIFNAALEDWWKIIENINTGVAKLYNWYSRCKVYITLLLLQYYSMYLLKLYNENERTFSYSIMWWLFLLNSAYSNYVYRIPDITNCYFR